MPKAIPTSLVPPRATKRPVTSEHHGTVLVDDYAWLRADNWQQVLAEDYWRPDYHVSLLTAMGRRIRRNYLWILSVQMMAYVGKLTIHPVPATSLREVVDRADTGPLPGELVLGIGIAYLTAFLVIAQVTGRRDARRSAQRGRGRSLG